MKKKILWNTLFEIIKSNDDDEKVKEILKESPNLINVRDSKGNSSFYSCCVLNRVKIAKYFIEMFPKFLDFNENEWNYGNRMAFNFENERKFTPFITVSRLGHLEILKMILKCKTFEKKNLFHVNGYGNALSNSIYCKQFEVAKFLISLKIFSINEKVGKENTPIFFFLIKKDKKETLEILEFVLQIKEEKLDLNSQDSNGLTFLHHLVRYEENDIKTLKQILSLLIGKGARIDIKNNDFGISGKETVLDFVLQSYQYSHKKERGYDLINFIKEEEIRYKLKYTPYKFSSQSFSKIFDVRIFK